MERIFKCFQSIFLKVSQSRPQISLKFTHYNGEGPIYQYIMEKAPQGVDRAWWEAWHASPRFKISFILH